jgi:hypothetical protein
MVAYTIEVLCPLCRPYSSNLKALPSTAEHVVDITSRHFSLVELRRLIPYRGEHLSASILQECARAPLKSHTRQFSGEIIVCSC